MNEKTTQTRRVCVVFSSATLIRMKLFIRFVKMAGFKMSVYLRRINAGMTEQHLDCQEVCSILNEMSCKAVPQSMHGEILLNADKFCGDLEITPDAFA